MGSNVSTGGCRLLIGSNVARQRLDSYVADRPVSSCQTRQGIDGCLDPFPSRPTRPADRPDGRMMDLRVLTIPGKVMYELMYDKDP